MSGTESQTVAAAVEAVLAGSSVSAAAAAHNVNVSSVRRALRRHGVAALPHPSGENHHAWVDGRRSRNRQRAAGAPAATP